MNKKSKLYQKVSKNELKAFIDLLYIAGALRLSSTNTEELWSAIYGNILFRATMSEQRFHFLASCLRFNNKNDSLEIGNRRICSYSGYLGYIYSKY